MYSRGSAIRDAKYLLSNKKTGLTSLTRTAPTTRKARPPRPTSGLIRWFSTNNQFLYKATDGRSNENDILKKPQSVRFIKDLPSELEARRHQFSKWTEAKLDDLQATVFTASRTLNDVTGYTSIQALKESIEVQARRIKHLREEFHQSKTRYAQAIQDQAESQRRVNELLQRKHQWSAADLENFTKSFGDEHAYEKVATQSQATLTQTEKELDEAQAELTRTILIRYHEEQIWSDKIRKASTWGTFFFLALNAILFVVVQLGMEPWKRKRLVRLFEGKVEAALEDDRMQRMMILQESNIENTLIPEISNKLTEENDKRQAENNVGLTVTRPDTQPTTSFLAPIRLDLPTFNSIKEFINAMLTWKNYVHFYHHHTAFVDAWPVPSTIISSIGGIVGIFLGRLIHAYFNPV